MQRIWILSLNDMDLVMQVIDLSGRNDDGEVMAFQGFKFDVENSFFQATPPNTICNKNVKS